MRYDGSAAVPALSGALAFGDLVMITEHGRATGATASGAAAGQAGPARTGASRWSAEPLDVSWMRGFNADLDLKANSLVYDHWNLKNAALKFTLRDGVLDVPNLSSGLFGGSMAVTANVQAPAQSAGALTMRSTASFKDVNVEDLVKGFVGIPLIKGQGRVTMDMAMSGSGTSQRALVNALAGNGTMTGREIVLEGFDLTRFAEALSEETKPGDSLLGLWKGTIKGGSTAFDTLDGAYTMNNGIADISKLNLDGPQALLATRGQVNLPAWTIQTAHTITLKEKPDVPPFTVNISGSLDNPGNTFAQGAINDYLSRKINRKLESIIGDKLGLPGLGGGAPPQAPLEGDSGEAAPSDAPGQSAPTPEEAIGNVLKGLLSR
jgi:AsmA protein